MWCNLFVNLLINFGVNHMVSNLLIDAGINHEVSNEVPNVSWSLRTCNNWLRWVDSLLVLLQCLIGFVSLFLELCYLDCLSLGLRDHQ